MAQESTDDTTAPSTGFQNLRVAAFESRRREEMERMIRQHGGQAYVSPSLREIPLNDNAATVEFAQRAMTGQVDVFIALTGVGFEILLQSLERRVDLDRFLNSLRDVITIARGPKPTAAMRKVNLQPTYRVPEPNTWRELLTLVDRHLPLANLQVVIAEYGRPNPSLIAGLEARGARVSRLVIYRWGLPEDTRPLESNVRALAAGERDVLLFTSAQQVGNLLEMARQLELSEPVRAAMRKAVIGSIGPTTSEELQICGFAADFESSAGKLGPFVRDAAAVSPRLVQRKFRVQQMLDDDRPLTLDQNAAWYDSDFMRACRRETVKRVPVWLMRQAGRYLPEYRAIREKVSFLELCKRPDLCTQIMVETVQRLGVDAAILFADLLPILEPMGLELEYAPDEGPVIHNPVRDSQDVDRVVALDSIESLDFVCETVRLTRAALPPEIPLIGFAGAPFTLASYAIEGGSTRHFLHTKNLMRRDEVAWRELMQRLSQSITLYLNAQIRSGVQCVQLFDSWVGCLSPADYRRYVLPFMREIIASLPRGVPVISFATGNPELLPSLAEARPHVVGVDWRISLDEAWRKIRYQCAVQGNLDPTILMAPQSEVRRATRELLQSVAGQPGHILNLGHGVLPQTPVDNVIALIDEAHQFT